MAKILFTWELGGGSGHVSPYIELVKRLESDGHQVFYALRHLDRAEKFFEGTNVTWLQAPVSQPVPESKRLPRADSYAKILAMSGYMTADDISGRVAAWMSLYRKVAPELIVFDFSPTAMLAARNHPAKRLAIGTGFHLPPSAEPIPDLCWHLDTRPDRAEMIGFEQQVLRQSNEAAARNGIEPLARLADLYRADATVFRTFRELDHYPQREDAEYWGVFRAPAGIRPEWPEGQGAKIFAYLKRFPSLPTLFNYLNSLKLPTLIYGDGLPEHAQREFGSATLKFVQLPIDMAHVGRHADLAITNAGHGTACELLTAGVPSLMLPLNLEQQLVAANVVQLGAGLSVPRLEPLKMRQALDTLLQSGDYKKAAGAFARRYRLWDDSNLTQRITNLIKSLLEGS